MAGQPASTVEPRLREPIEWCTGTAGRVDDDRARALLLAAAADDDAISRMWLARCFSTGRMGFEGDGTRARDIAAGVLASVRALATRGEMEAVFLMGTAHDEALGVEVDPAEAARWYRRRVWLIV